MPAIFIAMEGMAPSVTPSKPVLQKSGNFVLAFQDLNFRLHIHMTYLSKFEIAKKVSLAFNNVFHEWIEKIF